jgi:hypothetical protein
LYIRINVLLFFSSSCFLTSLQFFFIWQKLALKAVNVHRDLNQMPMYMKK